jgi:hypothetical protein
VAVFVDAISEGEGKIGREGLRCPDTFHVSHRVFVSDGLQSLFLSASRYSGQRPSNACHHRATKLGNQPAPI